MPLLKAIAIVADFTMVLIFGFFLRPLDWWHEADRAAIVGFWAMIAVMVLNICLLVWGNCL